MRGRRALCAALPPSHQIGPTESTAATSHGATAPAAPLMARQRVQRPSQASVTVTCCRCAALGTAEPLCMHSAAATQLH